MRAAPLLLLAASAGAYETDEREAWESPTMATPGGIARFAPRTADSVCTGISQALPAAECEAWATIYDAYDLGNLKPRSCAGGRTNPARPRRASRVPGRTRATRASRASTSATGA